MEQNTQKAKTAALLEAFGCALAYLLAGKLLATVLPAPAGGARALSFARHCVLAPVAEELVFRAVFSAAAKAFSLPFFLQNARKNGGVQKVRTE